MQSIFAKLLYEMEKQHDTVLVMIVNELGSTPRGTGAQMLVNASGPLAGTIGGGNAENLSILHAKELISQKHSDIHEYNLHKNEEEDIGMAIKAVTLEEIAVSIAGEMIYERALCRESMGILSHGRPMH